MPRSRGGPCDSLRPAGRLVITYYIVVSMPRSRGGPCD